VDLVVRKGDRLAIMGPNGIGKSTLLKILMGIHTPDAGSVEWGYETHPGYFAQDYRDQFTARDTTAEQWIWTFCPDKDLGFVRGRLALMLFTGDDPKKRIESLSGGEAARLVFSRIALEQPNVLVLDEPTNHLDLESIEALVEGLKAFQGTLILVSHDRWFVGELATRVVEIRADGMRDYLGTYEEYVHSCGDDHLDADQVILKAKVEKKGSRSEKGGGGTNGKPRPAGRGGAGPASSARGSENLDAIAAKIELAELRIREIDELFCTPGFYESTSASQVKALEQERAGLEREAGDLMERWSEGQVS
jgi:ABC-type multidrug transport system ATPase subunit